MEDEIRKLSLASVDKKAGTLFQGHMQQINEIFESKKIVCFEITKHYSFSYFCRNSTWGLFRVKKKLVQYSAQILYITGSEGSSKTFYT